jgi:hypothetical protein
VAECRSAANTGRAWVPIASGVLDSHDVGVTTPEKLVLTALGQELPDAAVVEGIEFGRTESGSLSVTLVSSTSVLLIGRRGAEADALRLVLAEAADDSALQLNIREWKPPSPGRFGLNAP